jgi:hypothetical protein
LQASTLVRQPWRRAGRPDSLQVVPYHINLCSVVV